MFNKSFDCPSCGYPINKNLSDYITSSSSEERSMGEEIEYMIECEGTCSNCEHDYKIEGSIWEYPIGCENYDDLTIK